METFLNHMEREDTLLQKDLFNKINGRNISRT